METMLATAERFHPEGISGNVEIIWHVPAEPETCDGECDSHRVLCDESPGIGLPGGLREVPVPTALNRSHERWCTACLSAVRIDRQHGRSAPRPTKDRLVESGIATDGIARR